MIRVRSAPTTAIGSTSPGARRATPAPSMRRTDSSTSASARASPVVPASTRTSPASATALSSCAP